MGVSERLDEIEYKQKNTTTYQNLKGSIYEEKIITLIKSKLKLEIKNINTKEAEKIISEFNKPSSELVNEKKTQSIDKNKAKSKKISKK